LVFWIKDFVLRVQYAYVSGTIEWSDFIKVDMRVGRIIDVNDFPEARKPAYILTVDFGPLGTRKTSAQVTNYTMEELLERNVVAVFNFPAKQIGPIMSEVLVLGGVEEDGTVRLLKPDPDCELGSRVA
jgi:tRNA-binding protein